MALYTPICVAGGEWNHVIAVCGAPFLSVGDWDLPSRFVLFANAFTASESEPDASADDSEPEIESSRPDSVD